MIIMRPMVRSFEAAFSSTSIESDRVASMASATGPGSVVTRVSLRWMVPNR